MTTSSKTAGSRPDRATASRTAVVASAIASTSNSDPRNAVPIAVRAPARDATVTGEQRDAVAVGVGIDERHGLVVGRHSHHAEHRAEDLVVVGAHAGFDVVEQRAAEKEAVARRPRGPVDDDARPLA